MTSRAARYTLPVTAAIVLFSFAFPTVALAQTVSFIARKDLLVGARPHSVAVADFNRDFLPDLVVANYASDTVSVLLGNGDGTFQPARTFPAGSKPTSVAVGDFNGDMVPDLALASRASDIVSVLLLNGAGSFHTPQALLVGARPPSVAVGDFNGDRVQDLAVANTASDTVSVLLGNGNGTFRSMPITGAGPSPTSVVAGDFNGDGLQDLAVTNGSSNTVSVLLGNGDGTLQAARTVTYALTVPSHSTSFVAVGDFNGDHMLDLAVANGASNAVSVLLGRGDGTFFQLAPPNDRLATGPNPTSVAV